MMGNLHGYHPLGIVDVHEMSIFAYDFLCFLQDFLVIEFGIISTFEVESPTLNFGIISPLDEFLNSIKHSEMFCLETFFYREYFVTKSSYLCLLFVNLFHEGMNNPMRIKLRVLRVNFNEDNALNRDGFTLTLVSTEKNNRFSILLISLS